MNDGTPYAEKTDKSKFGGHMRITSGNTPSALTFASGVDIVAMDDFIYAEPKTVPETGGIGLIGLGLGSVLFFYRRSPAVS
jgi:hypothetical protein